jgi:hypothetical protein
MTAPNIGAFTFMSGNTAVQLVSNVATAIVSNSVSSNQLFKIYSLSLTNTSLNTVATTVDLYRSSTAYRITTNLAIPSTSTIVVISKDNGVYLNEGDSLRLTAGANASVEAVCSYEVVA